ncbi:ABC transporter permease [Conexibacter stalactiti]|uniref:ABC transporter permease n=1 Tax=Conexibacter stalactiti TaxID=1940611 RepID=A0ABU4HUS0_9ACTN|nr:ABC transporter permease [Conexibacter stalactiti]MDW5597070.1 ABC transporter permease [Conexibacter stalactiti]MEC5037712.1 ABC transporter permease [Conexibacter stalactiti]
MSIETHAAVAAPAREGRARGWATSPVAPYVGLATVLVVLVAFQLATEPTFSSWSNLTNLMRSMAVPLLLAAAGTLVLLTAGVDLSIGALLGLSGIFYAKLATGGFSPLPALLLTLLAGGAIAFFVNGYLIGRVGMSFFVVTLGTGSILRGAAYLWSDNTAIDMSQNDLAATLGNTAILGDKIPVGILVAVGVAVLLWAILRYTVYGRSIYAVGGNREAAELSGVPSGWVIASVYGIVGLCAVLAGIMMIGRQTIADPNAGVGIELTVASAILLGGVALQGGVGSIWGAVLGTVFLSVLANALALHGLSSNWQLVVTGVILLLAVYLDRLRQRIGDG